MAKMLKIMEYHNLKYGYDSELYSTKCELKSSNTAF